MASQISGNAGGASASGARVYASPAHTQGGALSAQQVVADSSGNFTFVGLVADSYNISASTSDIVSGAYVSFVYRKTIDVVVDGVNNVSGIILTPVAKNSSNASA